MPDDELQIRRWMVVYMLGLQVDMAKVGAGRYRRFMNVSNNLPWEDRDERRKADVELELGRYELFGSTYRALRYLKDAAKLNLIDEKALRNLETFTKKVESVRSALEHMEDQIMGRPKGDRHNEMRVIESIGADASSTIITDHGVSFGNIIYLHEIEEGIRTLKELHEIALQRLDEQP